MHCPKEPIAIIGTACRFPGSSNSPSKLWELLQNPKDIVSQFPAERLNLSSFYNSDGERHGSTNVANLSYLLDNDIGQFDASFFNVHPREAEALDPQQRLLLETVYESLEAAGLPLHQVHGSSMAVYVGLMTSDWHDLQVRDPETAPQYAATGTARSIMSNRLSYFFDLHGPSVTIDTACSSSLVALHQAVSALRSGEAPSAIVAGANLILDPWMYIAESTLHMLSPHARSRMWDSRADGYARGEGFASIVLKPLGVALRDGDSIEAIVRETGVNSDGRTRGITMPSSTAQAQLIRQTYARAGLDIETERCQYFECHGTGTLAGDPVEAEALHHAFFADFHGRPTNTNQQKLYAGSIKTVVGHLEGTAGLAGLLKATLAVRHGVIPPNLHFEALNPAIAPFYENLCVPTRALPWPQTKGPRRASVNSFGFGGTNAHAIIESYEEPSAVHRPLSPPDGSSDRFIGPLVFSAQSGASLKKMIKAYAIYMKAHPELSLRDLTWVLDRRRSVLTHRAFFSGSTRAALQQYLDRASDEFEGDGGDEQVHRYSLKYPAEEPGVLGVFTGQGAQWASMGTALLKHSPVFRAAIERQQASLDALQDGPSWRIADELSRRQRESRVGEAEFSQTLCTALQVGMVDVLRHAKLHLDAVVGHSSGEIAAVYAAGIISAEDAIRIAYYRGLHARLALGSQDQVGGMLAVGMPMEAAQTFCQTKFSGRLCVAASNSPASVTLSGDKDAIDEAKALLEEKKTFARVLIVDKAYHSHHMQRCADAYRASLEACDIQIQPRRSNTVWVSSVRGDTDLIDEDRLSLLKSQYWVDNLLSPVLFSHALERACWRGGPFELVLEIGAHPALKGPSTQTFKSVLGHTVPYASLMRRGDDEVEAFSGGIGYAWQHLGPSFVDIEGFRNAFEDASQSMPGMLRDLPSYPWEHTRSFWKESRISRAYRLGGSIAHELLGRQTPDSWAGEYRWRNVLKLSNLPWLKGHVFQSQVLFPATGYIAMAAQAARHIANGRGLTRRKISTVEIQDFEIPKALVLKDEKNDTDGVETIFKISEDASSSSKDVFRGSFSCFVCHDEASRSVERTAFGRIEVLFSDDESIFEDRLPPLGRTARQDMIPIDMNQFYGSLEQLGLDYTGPFRRLRDGHRADGLAHVQGSWPISELSSDGNDYVIHPAFLDTAFHAVFCAYASPATGQLWAPFLPIAIGRLTIDPNVCFETDGEIKMQAHGFVTTKLPNILDSEIQVFNATGACGVCAESLGLKAMYAADESTDRALFIETTWEQDISSGLNLKMEEELPEEIEVIEATERMCLYYWQRLLEDIRPSEKEGLQWFHKLQLSAAQQFIDRVRQDQHDYVRPEWLDTSFEQIEAFEKKFPNTVDLQLAKVVGDNLPGVLRGEISLLEKMLAGDLLNQFYMKGLGLDRLNNYIAGAVQQIVHRYARPAILEIGAGTGGTTRSILDAIADNFSSYMYTDISAGFFEKAADKFAAERAKMTFKTLDVEKDPLQQGYPEGGYDIIVAANVLHATSQLRRTLQHTRSLLKPGGFLVMMEVTGSMARLSFIMGGLPGWWLGADEGRVLSPGVSPEQWDALLQETGFSGVSNVLHDTMESNRHACSLLISQAVDNTIDLVREPFASSVPIASPLVLVGCKSMRGAGLTRECSRLLRQFSRQLTVLNGIDALSTKPPPANASILVLEELDTPLLTPPVSQVRLDAFKAIFAASRDVLWISTGRISHSPASNMAVAVLRTMRDEIPGLNVQSLDFARRSEVNAFACVEAFLRLVMANTDRFLGEKLLWTVEPELVLDDGKLLIPRIRPNHAANNRYNAARRPILNNVRTRDVRVQMRPMGDKLVVYQMGPVREALRIDVDLCMPLPGSSLDIGPFLVMGSLNTTSQKTLALSDSMSSCVYVDQDEIYTPSQAMSVHEFASIADHIVAQMILQKMGSAAVAVNEAPEELTDILTKAVSPAAICFAGQRVRDLAGTQNVLHHKATRRMIKAVLPRNLDLFIDFAVAPSAESRFVGILDCDVISSQDCLQNGNFNMLAPAVEQALSSLPSRTDPVVLDASSLTESSSALLMNRRAIVRWPVTCQIEAALQPLNSQSLFRTDCSYLLVGLTGELGQAVCRYMLQNGARHIVLTSRGADPEAPWARELEWDHNGSEVIVRKMDVTDRRAVRECVDWMGQHMPKIAGVCNGAMVLVDSTLESMSADQMNDVLRPKVDGSIYLDELFSNDESSTTLDFFVLFSSMGTVMGNGGQSNYNAANLFMTGLAASRKQRGLPGSVIDIGFVTDVGYVARQARSVGERLRSNFWEPLSQKDVCQMFAEAIIAGRPSNEQTGQISMGIKPFYDTPNDTAMNRPRWYDNPRFAHMIREMASSAASAHSSDEGDDDINIRQQLERSASDTEAAAALIAAFSTKLEHTLQLNKGSIRPEIPLIDAGVDSLLAVEVRTWFLRETGVDVPVLKALSGDTIADICGEAANKFRAAARDVGDVAPLTASMRTATSSSTPTTPNAVHTENHELSSPVTNVSSQDESPSPETPSTVPQTPSPELKVAVRETSRLTHQSNQSAVSFISTNSADTTLASRRSSVSASAARGVGISRSETPVTDIDHGVDSNNNNDQFLSWPVHITRKEDMSLGQSRLWFLHELLEDKTTYNVTVAYTIDGPLQASRFRRAFVATVSQHEGLRTCLYRESHSGKLLQGVRNSPNINFIHVEDDTGEAVSSAFASYRQHLWDLEHGDVFGATLVSVSPMRHTVVFGYHHIAIDGFSWGVILQNLSDAYFGKRLAPVNKHAADFALDEHRALFSSETVSSKQEAVTFWRREHSERLELLPLLPLARVVRRHDHGSYESNTFTRELSSELVAAIKATSQSIRVGPLHFYISVIQALFQKTTGVGKICLGVTDANRQNVEYQNSVGFFLNFLPLIFSAQEDDEFTVVVKRAQRKVYDGLSHSSLPFELILDELRLPRLASASPLFQVAVNYRVASVTEVALGDQCTMRASHGDDAKNPYDLLWSITQVANDKTLLEITGRDDLYGKKEVEMIMNMYVRLLEQFAQEPLAKIADCSLYSTSDPRDGSASVGRGDRKDFSWPPTLSQRVREITTQLPDTPAIQVSGCTTTYAELESLKNRILVNFTSIPIGSRIALLCEPSETLIAAILAILDSGMIYVPLDLSLPASRHFAILDASRATVLIHDADTKSAATALKNAGARASLLNATLAGSCSSDTASSISEEISGRASADAAAFLLHTSGSTGTPKGIELTQSGCVNFIAGLVDRLQLHRERVLQQTSLGFDMSLAQLFVALCTGGTLVIAPQWLRGDVLGIAALMQKEQVSYTFQTPSEYHAMLRVGQSTLKQCANWKFALLGGEVVSRQLRCAFRSLNLEQLKIFNCYGPTEITITTTIDEISANEPESSAITEDQLRSIGYPCPNYSIYIVDSDLRLVPRGHVGQICVGGPGIALGYPNMPELAQEKFLDDPFASRADIERGWDRMYCTGDRGKMLDDGRIDFLGRMYGDTQVKLRGIRVELDEVSNAVISSTSRISAAVATIRGEPATIVVHAVFEPGQEMTNDELQAVIHRLPLPASIRPSLIIPIQSLPRTSNGKVDRRTIEELPLPQLIASSDAGDSSLTLAESELRLIWERVLSLPRDAGRIGADADFFLVGGNSLLLAQLQNVIRENMGLKVPIRDLYACSTLRHMAARITLDRQTAPAVNINWTEETSIPPEDLAIATSSSSRAMVKRSHDREILFTGATSFLGAHILRALLADSSIGRVHAIAIDVTQQTSLPKSDKLCIYAGSLFHPSLGLTEQEIGFLSGKIDVVVHAGAVGHCMNNYSSVKAANFVSTQYLARFALAHRIPLHFLSSGRVPLLRGDCRVRPVSVADIIPPSDGSQGFMVSKWASERFLEQLSIQAGLDVTIHRACAPVGDKAPSEDALNALLLYSQKLRATPIFENVEGFFDFENVEVLGASIARAVIQTHEQPNMNVQFRHHSSEVVVPIDAICKRMESVYGGSWDSLPVGKWLEKAKMYGIEDMIVGYLEAMVERGESIKFPYLGP